MVNRLNIRERQTKCFQKPCASPLKATIIETNASFRSNKGENRMLKIKLFVALAFLAFAACAFLFSNSKTQAQTSKNAKNRDEILEKVAGYKTWKQVVKPAKESNLDILKKDVFTISDSAVMG